MVLPKSKTLQSWWYFSDLHTPRNLLNTYSYIITLYIFLYYVYICGCYSVHPGVQYMLATLLPHGKQIDAPHANALALRAFTWPKITNADMVFANIERISRPHSFSSSLSELFLLPLLCMHVWDYIARNFTQTFATSRIWTYTGKRMQSILTSSDCLSFEHAMPYMLFSDITLVQHIVAREPMRCMLISSGCSRMAGPAPYMEEENKGDDNVLDKIKGGFDSLSGPDEALSELPCPGAHVSLHVYLCAVTFGMKTMFLPILKSPL